jgi:biotin transport system substrate-specific component
MSTLRSPTLSLSPGSPTIVDRLLTRGIVTDIVLIATGAAVTAIAAQISLPLWPVPITGQTFAVLLVGSALGALRGGLSLALYLVLGVVGLPVFADSGSGSLFASPTGGFIVGYVFAAALTGWLAQRQWDRRFTGTLVSFAAGSLVIYAIGLPWLFAVLAGAGTEDPLAATIHGGLLPFVIGDALKALVAAALLPRVWRLVPSVKTEA